MEPVLSVIIVSWNTRELLRGCLLSLQRLPTEIRVQVIVVDNASGDGSAEMVRTEFPRVAVLANDRNQGFAVANNSGLEFARGRYVLFLNPDTEVNGDAIGAMVKYLDGHGEVGIVGTTLLNPDGTVQLSCHRFYGFWHSLRHNRLVNGLAGHREMVDVNLARQPRDVEWMTGACLAVRRTVLDSVGAFDPRFFVYGEEIDLQFRIKRAGWRVVFVPSAGIIHYGGQSAKQAGLAASLHDYRGRWLFVRKHYPALSVAAYLGKTVLGLVVWTVYWGAMALVGAESGGSRQCRSYWQLLAWHLKGRELPPTPGLPEASQAGACSCELRS